MTHHSLMLAYVLSQNLVIIGTGKWFVACLTLSHKYLQCLKLSQKSCKSSCLESQIINIKLKKNQRKVPSPKLSASDQWTCGNFQHWVPVSIMTYHQWKVTQYSVSSQVLLNSWTIKKSGGKKQQKNNKTKPIPHPLKKSMYLLGVVRYAQLWYNTYCDTGVAIQYISQYV